MARWLLSHFGCSPNNDPVIGDLDERYRTSGRSLVWYWKQVLVAIVTSFFQEVWNHKLLAARSLFLGWVIKVAWLWFAGEVLKGLLPYYDQRFTLLLLASVTASAVVCAVSTWVVSRTSGRHYRAIVLLYILVELLAVPPMIYVFAGTINIMLWSVPFAAYFYIGLAKLGYPFESVIALWCGCILMAATMLIVGRILVQPSVPKEPLNAAN